MNDRILRCIRFPFSVLADPLVSVVIAAHGNAFDLPESLESVLSQTFSDLECVVVCDGRLAPSAHRSLSLFMSRDPRIRVLCQDASGLTQALITGCADARGELIARLDVGDIMHPRRLECHVHFLRREKSCVLATSDVRVCGPSWEYLRIDTQTVTTGVPVMVDDLPPQLGISFDIPHHASVTFRRDAYEKVGGYRHQFYFGQDWDLWYRLADLGSFLHLAQPLTCVRVFPYGLSSRYHNHQKNIAAISRECYAARRLGLSEEKLLAKAYKIRPSRSSNLSFALFLRRADGFYFIAESLRRNGDNRCFRYFALALRFGFWRPRILFRAIQAFSRSWLGRPIPLP